MADFMANPIGSVQTQQGGTSNTKGLGYGEMRSEARNRALNILNSDKVKYANPEKSLRFNSIMESEFNKINEENFKKYGSLWA